MSEEKYQKVAQSIVKAGRLPFPINNTLLEILRILIDEDELDFIIKTYKRKFSLTLVEIKKRSSMEEEQILQKIESLAKKGVIFNQPNRQGIMVYRLLPLIMVGSFEYTFMKTLKFSDDEKEIAELFKKLFDEVKEVVHSKYDAILPVFKSFPPIDRTIAILDKNVAGNEIEISLNREIDPPEEEILLTQNVRDLINKFEKIAVGHCFCRHYKDLLSEPCKQTNIRENCLTFGKSANYITEQGFGRIISREEALKILKDSEDAGLVHKAFHVHEDLTKDETSICNCCFDCCATFEFWREGVLPMMNSTNHLAEINKEICIGCETCIEKCPINSISLIDGDKAEVNKDICLGCGVCAHFCPEGAINLLEGRRTLFIEPPGLNS